LNPNEYNVSQTLLLEDTFSWTIFVFDTTTAGIKICHSSHGNLNPEFEGDIVSNQLIFTPHSLGQNTASLLAAS